MVLIISLFRFSLQLIDTSHNYFVQLPTLVELIPIGMLQAINIEGLSLDKFLEQQVANCGWILQKGHGRGQLIVLPRNEFNQPELKKNAADSVPFEHITRIFPILGG